MPLFEGDKEKTGKNLYYYGEKHESTKPILHATIRNMTQDWLRDKTSEYTDEWNQARDAPQMAFEQYFAEHPELNINDYREAQGNIDNQFRIAAKTNEQFVTEEEIYNKQKEFKKQLLEKHPEWITKPFNQMGENIQKSPAINREYDTVFNTYVQHNDTATMFESIRNIPEGSDIAMGYHSGHTFSGISLSQIGQQINMSEADNLFNLTCSSGYCVDDFNLNKATTYFRPNDWYQGVYQKGKTIKDVFFSRLNGKVNRTAVENKHFSILAPNTEYNNTDPFDEMYESVMPIEREEY